jgi:hypothetical protein
MGMLIRRHRDRHSEDATPAPRPKRTRNRSKAPEQVDPPKARDAEADKAPDTEPDPGAGGEQVTPTNPEANSGE